MKKILLASPLLLALQSCDTTFSGSLFVFRFGDMVMYVIIVLILAGVIGFLSERRKMNFWIAFVLGLFLTPLASLIWLLILLTNRRKKHTE